MGLTEGNESRECWLDNVMKWTNEKTGIVADRARGG